MYSVRFTGSHSYAYDLEDLGKYYRLYEDLMNYWNYLYPHMIYEEYMKMLLIIKSMKQKKCLNIVDLTLNRIVYLFMKTRDPLKLRVFTR